MKVWSSIQCGKWHIHEREFNDHDVSLSRSWEMFIGCIVESSGRDSRIWKYRSIELRHFGSVVVGRPEASGEHRGEG